MSKNMKRLRDVGGISISSLVMLGIVYKLILRYDDWLFKSLGWVLPYGLAWLLKSYMFDTKNCKKTLFVISASFAIAISTLFVSGVVLSLDDSWWHTYYITIAFVVGYILARPSKYEDDKSKENKTGTDKEDIRIVV